VLALAFYLGYPLVWLVSILPFPVLYGLSDTLALLVRLIGYRKKVIQTNLRKSFPEKPEKEIRRLTREYYHYLCDITLETFKMMQMPEGEVRKRIQLVNPELMQRLYDDNKSVIIALGHLGNWEWYGQSISLFAPHQFVIIYRPLSNVYFDRMMQRIRTRFGIEITTMKLSMRTMLANKNRLTATAFVGDQAAPVGEHWMTFLNQDSSVYTGIEKMAKKLNMPVVYLHPTRPRRGYYTLEAEVIVEEPMKTGEFEITEIFTRRLERDIRENPVFWLWSHKRWKIQRPQPHPKK
jgi:KDO2-lipid IV(A) lauroyltransferase